MNAELSFGIWLRQRRKALDLTQKELARRVACATITLRKIEAEERRPSKQVADRLAEILGIAPEERAAFVRYARGEMRAASHISPATLVAPWREPPQYDNVYLPVPLTRLIGREREVSKVVRWLVSDDTRLLTLIGPPGIGKTRLGLQVALECAPDFPDGVFFVALAAISDPDLVASTTLRALGLMQSGHLSAVEVLIDSLADKQVLLIVDNFEQVIEAAPIVADLLTACLGLKILVTSRTVLRVFGERLFPVPPLALPVLEGLPAFEEIIECPAVQLFVERAMALKPDFSITAGNAPAIAAICTHLDGLPLAIELVAARTLVLPPEALLARLSGDLALHTNGMRGVPDRQRTIYSAIGWSYNLLSPEERAFFVRLGVYVGGWTLAAAQQIASVERPTDATATQHAPHAALDTLTSLVNQSLIVAQEEEGEPRFTMLEMIREYALAQLEARGEIEAVRQRHAEYFLKLAETAGPELTAANQSVWLERLAREHDNLRAAFNWSLQSDQVEIAARLSSALWRFWYVRRHFDEGRRCLEQVLEALKRTAVPLPVRAQVLNAAGVLASSQADYAQANALLEECLAIQRQRDDKEGIANALGNLGLVAANRYDYVRAREFYAESLALMRELGDQFGIATALRNLGHMALMRGEWDHGIELHEECLPLVRQMGDKASVAIILNNLGGAIAKHRGDYVRATALLEESLAIARELGGRFHLINFTLNHLGQVALYQGDAKRALALLEESLSFARGWKGISAEGGALKGLGRVALHQGDLARARQLLHASLRLFHQLSFNVDIVDCLDVLVSLSIAQGQLGSAAVLLAATDSLTDAICYTRPRIDQANYERNVASLRAQLDDETFTTSSAKGRSMSLEQVIAYALELGTTPR